MKGIVSAGAWVATAILVIVAAGHPVGGVRQGGAQPMNGSAPVFLAIDQIVAMPRLDPAGVARVTGMELVPGPGSTGFFKVFIGGGTGTAGWCRSVDLRVALPGAAKSAGDRVVLTLAPTIVLGIAELVKQYGQAIDISPASPTALGDAPSYYTFRRGNQIVSFGFLRSQPSRASTVVIERGTR